MSLLETGRFLTIVPSSMLLFFTKRWDIKVLPVELPMTRMPNGIVTLKNRALSPAAQLFVNTACEIAKSLAKNALHIGKVRTCARRQLATY